MLVKGIEPFVIKTQKNTSREYNGVTRCWFGTVVGNDEIDFGIFSYRTLRKIELGLDFCGRRVYSYE